MKVLKNNGITIGIQVAILKFTVELYALEMAFNKKYRISGSCDNRKTVKQKSGHK